MDLQTTQVLKQIYSHAVWLLEQHGVECEDRINIEVGRAQEDWFDETATRQTQLPPTRKAVLEPSMIPTPQTGHQQPPIQDWGHGNHHNSHSNQFNHPPPPPPPSRRPPPGPFPSTHHPPMPNRMTRQKSDRQLAIERWEQHKQSGWKGTEPAVKVNPQPKPQVKPSEPEPARLIPPQSKGHPHATADLEKLQRLQSNFHLMQFELTKICRKNRISVLNESDLSIYPKAQQGRLKIAIDCVTNARRTLAEYKEFLSTDKYKDWNDKEKERTKATLGS
jgi:hypothetical protein